MGPAGGKCSDPQPVQAVAVACHCPPAVAAVLRLGDAHNTCQFSGAAAPDLQLDEVQGGTHTHVILTWEDSAKVSVCALTPCSICAGQPILSQTMEGVTLLNLFLA